MKISLWFLGIFLSLVASAEDFSGWSRVMTDTGVSEQHWVMISSPANPLKKNLSLNFSPGELKSAAVEYELNVKPYDSKLKTHVSTPDYHWANWQIKVNGTVILDQPAGPYIGKGVHRVKFPAKLLTEGVNTIELGWKKLTQDEQGKVYGFVYVSIDMTDAEKARRQIPVAKRPAPANDSLHIRLLVQ